MKLEANVMGLFRIVNTPALVRLPPMLAAVLDTSIVPVLPMVRSPPRYAVAPLINSRRA